jgi:hypothetical protein
MHDDTDAMKKLDNDTARLGQAGDRVEILAHEGRLYRRVHDRGVMTEYIVEFTSKLAQPLRERPRLEGDEPRFF